MPCENEICFETPQDFTFEEFQDAFYKIIEDFKLCSLKNKELRKQNQFLMNENIEFQKKKIPRRKKIFIG